MSASARTVNAVVPYYGWARQDRKSKPRVSIGAKLVANMLGVAGIDRVITMDLHADQEQGFFEVPVDHLFASTILLPYVKNLNLKNICIATPDVGGSKRASTYAKYLDCPMVICNKTRKRANEVDSMDVIGDVKDMDVVLVDDMVDTAGTITKAADLMHVPCVLWPHTASCPVRPTSESKTVSSRKWSSQTLFPTPVPAQK